MEPCRYAVVHFDRHVHGHASGQPGVRVFLEIASGAGRRCRARIDRISQGGGRWCRRWRCAGQSEKDRSFMAALHQSKTRLQAGFVAMDPATGAVRAWVGSRDFAHEQFDHVAQAARQPGSTFKPIVYGAALEKGLSPDHVYRDAVMDIKAADGSKWRPTDMSGTTGRDMTMRDGLVYSKNTITAQVMQDVGLPDIIKLARALGVRDSKLAQVPSLALGTSPVTLLEMVNAYASIAAQGEARLPFVVTHITDRTGKTIARFGDDKPKRAMTEKSANMLTDMMRGVIDRGTGTAIRNRFGIRSDVAGKSGTTQNNADGWFIMMHPELVGGAWVGFNDARVTMRSNYWGQGGHNAVLLVGDFFKTALESGKLSRDAIFPGGKPPPPLHHVEPVEAPQEEPVEEPGDLQQEGVPVAPAAPQAMPAEGADGQETHGNPAPQAAPAPVPAAQPAPAPVVAPQA